MVTSKQWDEKTKALTSEFELIVTKLLTLMTLYFESNQ